MGLAGLEARLRETELALSRTDEGDRGLGGLLDEHSRLERHFEHLGGFGFEAAALKVLRGLGFAQEDGARNCSEFSGGWQMCIVMAALLLSGSRLHGTLQARSGGRPANWEAPQTVFSPPVGLGHEH